MSGQKRYAATSDCNTQFKPAAGFPENMTMECLTCHFRTPTSSRGAKAAHEAFQKERSHCTLANNHSLAY